MKFADLRTKTVYICDDMWERYLVVLDADSAYRLHSPYRYERGERLYRVEKSKSKRYETPRFEGWMQGALSLRGGREVLNRVMASPSFDAFVERVTSGEPFDMEKVVEQFFGEGTALTVSIANPRRIEGEASVVEAQREAENKAADERREAERQAANKRNERREQAKRDLADLGIDAPLVSDYLRGGGHDLIVSIDTIEALIEKAKRAN